MRDTTLFNDNWLFFLGDGRYEGCGALEDDFREVTLPHDWAMDYPLLEDAPTGGGGGFGASGIGWYRKHVDMKKPAESEKVELYFEGIYMDSSVYVNGEYAGGHGYGYSSFYVDITDYLRDGDNLIAVRVNNSLQPNSRWYSGSGIYRDVYLVKTGMVHFGYFGIRACTNGIYFEQNEAALQIRSLVANESGGEVHTGIIHRLYDAAGEMVSSSGIALSLNPGEENDAMVRPTVVAPHLWTDEDPYLYRLVSTLYVDGEAVDEVTNRIGIRTAVFDAKKGFLLNGKQVKIKGMCVHHDCGITGAVGFEESWRRRLLTLRDMGCNGIRCSHNPPVPVLLDLCDELGFLVMDEVFDEWLLAKNKTHNYYSESLAYGSSMFFSAHADEDTTTMIRRDFNHPSVVIWSIGNEIPEQSSIDGVKIAKMLVDICHREDSSRQVTSACDNIAAVEPIRTLREFENALDVVGYNYAGRWRERAETFYDEDHELYPDRPLVGTENGSAGGERGVYDGSGRFGDYSLASFRHEALWRYPESHAFVSGDYLWTGIDYLGETRWPSRGAACGPIDSAGFKKDTFYYFRSIWNKKVWTLHIAPQWNFKGQEGQYKTVVVYTNCEEVKLFINDRFVAKRGLSCPRYGAKNNWFEGFDRKATTNDLHLTFDVVYEPGTLRAEGYVGGELVMTDIVETTGKAEKLLAEVCEKEISVGRIAQIELSTEDAEGRFVPDVNETVKVSVDGPATLLGLDGGDMKDLTMYSQPERCMFSGRLLAVIRATDSGLVKLSFETESGLKAEAEITVK